MQKVIKEKAFTGSFSVYLKEIRKASLLNANEEKDLANKTALGDKSAENELIVSNLRLVVNIAKRYPYSEAHVEDLVGAGNLALVTNVKKFDPNKGFRFSTYSTHWIKQGIMRSIETTEKMIKLPSYINELKGKIKKSKDSLRNKLNREPYEEEMALDIGVSTRKIKDINANASAFIVSLDEPVSSAISETGNGDLLFLDGIEDTSGKRQDEALNQKFEKELVIDLLSHLKDNERIILTKRFGIDCEKQSLAHIAVGMNLTRERIRQIEKKALFKLRRLVNKDEI